MNAQCMPTVTRTTVCSKGIDRMVMRYLEVARGLREFNFLV